MAEELLKERALELWRAGYVHQMRGDLPRAIELYSESIKLHPTAEAYTFRGWAYRFLDRIDEAIAECRKAITVDPEFGNPYNDIGAYLIDQGKLDEAIEWLNKAKRAARYEPRQFPFMNLGRLYEAKGMINQAIAEFAAALEIAPGDPTCEHSIARLRAMLN
ncbi:MAG TPA: tetratricopeptide repeat protein [Candidatus Binataceae bacterium]|nr:tetratricopeptide repeat protein [Candidatus Binataceae bacterium]